MADLVSPLELGVQAQMIPISAPCNTLARHCAARPARSWDLKTETATWTLDPTAAHRLVGGEYFIVTADRAFHHVHVPSAVTLYGALAGGPKSQSELTDALCANYRVDREAAAQDVANFIRTLAERGLAAQAAGGDAVVATTDVVEE